MLSFGRAEIGSLFFGVLIGAIVSGDGRANWYKGVQLITVYAIIALMFYFIPASRRRRSEGALSSLRRDTKEVDTVAREETDPRQEGSRRKEYDKQLRKLQAKLCDLQEWVGKQGVSGSSSSGFGVAMARAREARSGR